ncbi:unnamed protein product [Parnassius mnemosyne]|uniref:PiggyBac transposable element-derived protein domain-containing protein n=1 Tax=Parnassius mnemosyne TaxID=213953 RepID=A0AAV1KNM4_9NEOP
MDKNLNPQQIQDLLNDLDCDENVNEDIFPDASSDLSDAESEISDHNTESEEEAENISENEDSSDIDEQSRNSNSFYGRNRYKWSKVPPSRSRVPAHNIIIHLPGLRGPALVKNEISPLEAWSCIFTEDMIELILQHTNEKITNYSENYTSNSVYTYHVTREEILAFIGLMFLTGIFKSAREDARGIWSTKTRGRPIFRTVMSLNRFLFILSCLRFDEQLTREERKKTDRLALISELFNKFIKNCITNYSCSEYVTVDEMLVPFRGRCIFRKEQTSRANTLLIPTRNVLTLTEPIYQTNRNVTGDNWFSSIELVDALKQKGLTYVGTIRVNSHVLYCASNPQKRMSRYKFLEELGYALVTPHVMNRRSMTNLSKELKDMIDKFLREVGVELPEDQPAQGPSQNKRPKKSRCHLCPRLKDSNTPRVCSKCMKNVCRNHSVDVIVCAKCQEKY